MAVKVQKREDKKKRLQILSGELSLPEVGMIYQQFVKCTKKMQLYLRGFKCLAVLSSVILVGRITLAMIEHSQYRYIPSLYTVFMVAGFQRWILVTLLALLLLQFAAFLGDYMIHRQNRSLLEEIKMGYPRVNQWNLVAEEIDNKLALSCKSCGGNHFMENHKRGKIHLQCRYCTGELLLSKDLQNRFKAYTVSLPRFLTLRIALFVLTAYTCLVFGINYTIDLSGAENRPAGIENIDLIEHWDRELFESIDVAEKVHRGFRIRDFEGGDYIGDLRSRVGEPNRTVNYEINGRAKVELIWHSQVNPSNMSKIIIAYLPDTGQIIAKDVFGRR